MPRSPIGVFDSGAGGLSVLRAIRDALPGEDLVYVADSGFAPYGERPRAFIEGRAAAIAEFLAGQGVKAIVVACNTATALAIESLRSRFAIAMVAIEPAVKPAAETTKTGVIGVLATRQTLASESFARLVERHGRGLQILPQPCPGLVEQVEKGELDGAETRALVRRYVAPLLERGADTIVLGCTHFPFLASAIRALAGAGVAVLDPAAAVARELRRRLQSAGRLRLDASAGSERFWTSGVPHQVESVFARLWGEAVTVTALPAEISASR